MTALSVHLENHANYESSIKHADSVMRLLTNASFRSLFLWKKEDVKNKRENMNYEVIESVPTELRMYILEQMATLEHIYERRRRSIPEPNRPPSFDQSQWIGKVRSMFGISNGHAYLKQAMVIFDFNLIICYKITYFLFNLMNRKRMAKWNAALCRNC